MENEKIKSNGTNIKNFWFYALILFSVALILILISNFFQDRYFDTIVNTKDIENMSVVQSIQKINEDYKNKIEKYEEDLIFLQEQNLILDGNNKLAEQNIEVLIVMNDIQSLCLIRRYTAAREKLAEVDRDILPENIASIYDKLYDFLY